MISRDPNKSTRGVRDFLSSLVDAPRRIGGSSMTVPDYCANEVAIRPAFEIGCS